MSKIPTSGNQVTIRKNTGADAGTRPRLNYIEGANVTLTVADDPGSNEVDITIAAAAGGGGTAWLDQFFPAGGTDSIKGAYAAVELPDLVDTDLWQTFMMPNAIVNIVRAVAIVIPSAAGNFRWECVTNFGAICSNASYQQHTDSIGATASAVTQNEIECIDISAALTGALGGDLVGIKFTRTASNIADTVSASVYYVGIIISGSV